MRRPCSSASQGGPARRSPHNSRRPAAVVPLQDPPNQWQPIPAGQIIATGLSRLLACRSIMPRASELELSLGSFHLSWTSCADSAPSMHSFGLDARQARTTPPVPIVTALWTGSPSGMPVTPSLTPPERAPPRTPTFHPSLFPEKRPHPLLLPLPSPPFPGSSDFCSTSLPIRCPQHPSLPLSLHSFFC
jgi:hypothetical protein